jgi:hypothetical protein
MRSLALRLRATDPDEVAVCRSADLAESTGLAEATRESALETWRGLSGPRAIDGLDCVEGGTGARSLPVAARTANDSHWNLAISVEHADPERFR